MPSGICSLCKFIFVILRDLSASLNAVFNAKRVKARETALCAPQAMRWSKRIIWDNASKIVRLFKIAPLAIIWLAFIVSPGFNLTLAFVSKFLTAKKNLELIVLLVHSITVQAVWKEIFLTRSNSYVSRFVRFKTVRAVWRKWRGISANYACQDFICKVKTV